MRYALAVPGERLSAQKVVQNLGLHSFNSKVTASSSLEFPVRAVWRIWQASAGRHDALLRSLQLLFVADQKRSLDAQSVLWGTTAPGFGKSLFGGAAHGPAPTE